MLRWAFVYLVLAGNALADPAAKPDPWDQGRTIRIEPDGTLVTPIPDPHDPSRGAPAYGGGWAAGHVITPPAIADARDYPKGMVIRPPHTGDERAWPNGIWLVPDWGKPGDLWRGLGDGLQDGLGALGRLLAPKVH